MVKNKKKRTLIGVLTVFVLIAAFIGGTLIADILMAIFSYGLLGMFI